MRVGLAERGPTAATAAVEHDGLSSVARLGAGDSTLYVNMLGYDRTHLPQEPAAAAAALTAELKSVFEAGEVSAEAEGPQAAGEANPLAAIVTSVGEGGRYPLYRYPAAGGTRPLIAAQQDWASAPLVAAVRAAAAHSALGTSCNHAVING